ncbi:unnamed protein product [Rangifer tarandus platyrhynchus]|uniref:Uncharacterized protein n=2 Tax=Rangifer tarandus platyrhynchus TaxID=3082113 RepID=A0ACB0DXP8_RANTA|nr:unnamed protein product [Rangifer tarandus platyrhynchus]CAI9693128.1 unnamed protein product [Rangifer tarandus platyrhynchus]
MNGVWKNNCPQFVHDFRGFEKVDEEFRDLQQLHDHQEKMELGLHEDNFIELLAGQHRKLMSEDLVELEAQRKDRERQQGE